MIEVTPGERAARRLRLRSVGLEVGAAFHCWSRAVTSSPVEASERPQPIAHAWSRRQQPRRILERAHDAPSVLIARVASDDGEIAEVCLRADVDSQRDAACGCRARLQVVHDQGGLRLVVYEHTRQRAEHFDPDLRPGGRHQVDVGFVPLWRFLAQSRPVRMRDVLGSHRMEPSTPPSGQLFRIPVNSDGSAGPLTQIETSLPLSRPDRPEASARTRCYKQKPRDGWLN